MEFLEWKITFFFSFTFIWSRRIYQLLQFFPHYQKP